MAMEGGVLIRRPTYFKIVVISVFCFFLIACSCQKSVNVQPVKIHLSGSGLNPFAECVFEITADAKLKVTRGSGPIYKYYLGEITDKDYLRSFSNSKQKIVRLSKKDIDEIDNMMLKIKENGVFNELDGPAFSDISTIRIKIDNVEYMCDYFIPEYHFEMNDLQKLACKLVELSPLNLGEYYVGTQ